VDLYLDGLDGAGDDGRRDADPASVDEWDLGGPRSAWVVPGGPADRWTAAGTSSHYVVVDAASAGGVEVAIEGPEAAELQVTMVPLPRGLPRLELEATVTAAGDGDLRMRGVVREADGQPVRLASLSWQPAVPPVDPRAGTGSRGRLDMLGIGSSFGTSALPGRGTLRSRPIRLEGSGKESGPLIVRLIGVDSGGRRVATSVEIEPHPGSTRGGSLPLAGDPH
jgi:hypothetical protein